MVLAHLEANAPPWQSEPRASTRAMLAERTTAASRPTVAAPSDREGIVRLLLSSLDGLTLPPVLRQVAG